MLAHCRSVVLLLFVIPMLFASAQDVFTVMSVKGSVEYASGKGGKWKKLTVGLELRSNGIVRTAFDSYCKLMLNTERLVSIDQKSTIPLREFIKQKVRNGQSTAGNILQYVSDQMKSRSKPREKDLDLGAVRGQLDAPAVLFPKYAILTTTPEFRWNDDGKAGPYHFQLYDENFDLIEKRDTDALVYPLPKAGALTAGRTYYWKVTRVSDGLASDIQTFLILPKDSIAAVQAEVARLEQDLVKMLADDVTRNLILAVYYEKKGLYENAIASYRATISIAKSQNMDASEYIGMLRNLLRNLRFVNEEELLLK